MRPIDGDKLMMHLADWWYSSFGQDETEEAKAIKAVMDEIEQTLGEFALEKQEKANEQYIFHNCQHDYRWSCRMAIYYRSFGRRIDSVRCRNLACNQQSNWINGGERQ